MDDEPDGMQLRGKQLVFQAMSAIVVAVAIFLLGVMVGRGVPTPRQPSTVVTREDVDPLVPSSAIPPGEELTTAQDGRPEPGYQDDLFSDKSAGTDRVKAPAARPQPFSAESAVASAPAAPASARRPPVEQVASVGAKGAEPDKPQAGAKAGTPERAAAPATGFVVQVAAYPRQGDADSVRDRLVSKGYPAFVTSAATAAGTFFRVRVGGYDKEADAKSVAARLKREEHLEPWVTR